MHGEVHIKNVKISIYLHLRPDIIDKIRDFSITEQKLKKTASFVIFRDINFIYTIFFSGHINCTRIKHPRLIPNATERILSKLRLLESDLKNVVTDSILAVAKISNYICMVSFAKYLKQNNFNVQFNPQRFPGICVRKPGGCILTFVSGKVVFTGFKSEEKICSAKNSLIQTYNAYTHLFTQNRVPNC